jgi:outer membrane protein TolC
LFQPAPTVVGPIRFSPETETLTVSPNAPATIPASSGGSPRVPAANASNITLLPNDQTPADGALASAGVTNHNNPSIELAAGPFVAEPQPSSATPAPAVNWNTDELPEWWSAKLADLQRNQAAVRSVGLSDLINQAVTQSPKIRMLQRLPALAETQVQRERSEFDPLLRLDTQYRSDRDPVGNQLQTGGPPVLRDNGWSANASVQRRFANGTTADLYQRLGFKNSNSLFFSPQDQGTATVGLDVTHPLWRNSGREFNQSLIVIAELQGQVSFFEYQAELQKEMIEIGNLYWQLLNARKIALQVARSRDRAQEILGILTARTDYDTSANQVSLAKAEVSQRHTEWLDTQQRLRDLEISLRDKINDPQFASAEDVELIPAEFFADVFAEESITLSDALELALATRWELQREERLTRVADRQLFVSRCGLAPKLDLVLGVYSSGLAGDSGVEQAWTNQFGAATPGFYGGFDYELPYGRRQAKADIQRDQLQKQQALDAYQVVRNEVVAQVRTAHSRVDTAIQARAAAYQTVLDMRDALAHMQRRWEATALLDGGAVAGMAPSIALEQLLAAQRRLQDAEQRLANADLQWALARQALMLAMGQVLQSEVPSETAGTELAPDALP